LNEYDADRVLQARTIPPRYFKLSYLVTAWTQRPEDEHRLLTLLLRCFLRYDAVPKELLSGSLAALDLPAPMSIALPPPEDRAFADVWSALGGELKPSLDLVVSAPAETGQRYPVAPLATEPMTLAVNGKDGQWPPREERSGRAAAVPQPEDETPARSVMRRRRKSESG
jgi:hypothetical protein